MKNIFPKELYTNKPIIFVISGPSGIGKDSVLKELQRLKTPFRFVITAASRKPREGEVHGVDYFFVTKNKFEEMIANNELIEFAIVYDEYKGVPRWQVDEALQSGEDIILRLDVQGAAKIKELYPDAKLIFLIPENQEEWYQRLINRKSETPEKLQIRISTALNEINRINEFDYVVINAKNKLSEAADAIIAIIKAEHRKVIKKKQQ
ncbi:MAG: guanylate kinase [Anaerolineaceae bacterium]|nr:guanylate kinase [Anaerolineaceae bacterium]